MEHSLLRYYFSLLRDIENLLEELISIFDDISELSERAESVEENEAEEGDDSDALPSGPPPTNSTGTNIFNL